MLKSPECLPCQSKVQREVRQYSKVEFYHYLYHIAFNKTTLTAIAVQ